MSVKRYGIYLAFPPTVDLRDQGLGRHLAMFLKGAERLDDVQFTIVCPSWTKETLEALFESEQVPSQVFDIVAPVGKPYALRLFLALRAYRARPKRGVFLQRIAKAVEDHSKALLYNLIASTVAVHNLAALAGYLIKAIPLLMILILFGFLALPIWVVLCIKRAWQLMPRIFTRFHQNKWVKLTRKTAELLATPQNKDWVLRLFDEMQKWEVLRMQTKIAALGGVRAWYCPTAFWPSFHDIKAPRLMCVPDVVLADFPTGFSSVGGDRFLSIFETIGRSIREGEQFVTYSDAVKWNTVVDRYGVRASNVTVIPHAPNALNQYIEVRGFPDAEATSRHYCRTLLQGALIRSTNPAYTAVILNLDVKFLFYASQLRPNKNVLLLLRAFEYLLRTCYVGHKLFLTGRPKDLPEIWSFVVENRLENDVIFLPGLSVSELAACYKLATLAVNPTLSEGGCPFTFTEALSVGTPVVLSRIPVAEEVLTDPDLQKLTFFDPYDWRDCARRIEWAIAHRDELLEIQRETYALLIQRTWSDVVAEHVRILDQIADAALQIERP